MNRRREPRKSSLKDLSPAAPPTVPAKSSPEKPQTPTAKRKVSFYLDEDTDQRMRAACMSTMVQAGHRSLTEFIQNAVSRHIQELEREHNKGERFPSVGTGEMPKGRPLGS